MQNTLPVFFHDDDDENGQFEDIDNLFSQLESFEPPSDMVARIMDVVSKLPSPHHLQQQSSLFPELEGLIVRQDKKDPS